MESGAQLGLLDDASLPDLGWRVRPSARARRLAVRVLPGGLVEVVVPHGTRPRTVERFVSHHRRWIERTLDLYRPSDAHTGNSLPERVEFQATGSSWRVELREHGGPPRLRSTESTIEIHGSRDRPALLRHLLQRFTMREAHSSLSPWLDRVAAAMELGFERVQIRRQRTRWGSCSRSGTISLNACLMFQPPEVVNYLLIHELAHTRHMNHSRRFWRLVEMHEPRWRQLDGALTRGWRAVPGWAIG